MSYFSQFNTLSAEKAKSVFSYDTIQRTGKYIGQFTQAVCFEAPSGAKGIEFEFISDSGEHANFSLYTCSKDGKDIFSANQVHAIMVCLRLRGAGVGMQKANVWDNNERKRVEKLVPQLTGMLNKPIGILLEKEEYFDGNGNPRYRMNFKHAFEAATELMADEVLAQKEAPERLPREVSKLKDQLAKPPVSAPPFYAPNTPKPPAAAPVPAFDDDIPF
ncbi:hypothetical protein AXE65_06560 [Ventosimonas gracilis]|uniref:Uncharacterized protein n=1 Tax=Ventosimonas gracilis TaxID=1680762 RepID=A0A139SK52_9GAMM|nr:hypothetical protein [Ventosimonas gracilis]KXU34935.1 hypothetical protein AXE65_06560 [Ventosimonas gracilis]